jgi:hypothetical protein
MITYSTHSARADFSKLITATLKILFQNYHLYQTITIDYNHIVNKFPNRDKLKIVINQDFINVVNREWVPTEPSTNPISFIVPDIKIYCSECKEREAFNHKLTIDPIIDSDRLSKIKGNNTVQNFIFVYECQVCKSSPVVFLVRRTGMDLKICGRAPIEHIEVPKDIPKDIRQYYSDAVVAYNSGKTLAALFYLRVLIEQWAIIKTSYKPEKKEDQYQLLEKYMETIEPKYRDIMPSLSEVYSKLSADLHSATGSSKLFNEMLEMINKHFEIRRAHGIS